MAKYINIGETLEGNCISCVVRKWTWRGLKKHPITNKLMSLYVTDKNSTAEIIASCPEPSDEAMREKTAHFHREIGDVLEADALSVYIDDKRRVTPDVVKGASHRHGANKVQKRKHAIAEIKVPLDTLKKLLGYSANQITK